MATVSDLLLDIGRAKAAGELGGGEAWGNAVQQLGQIPGQSIAQMRQANEAAQNAKLRGVQTEEAQLGIDAAKRQASDAGALDTAVGVGQSGTLDPDAIEAALPGHLKLSFRKSWNDAETAKQNLVKSKTETANAQADYFGALANGVRPFLSSPDGGVNAATIALQHAKEAGFTDADQLIGQIQQNPQALPQIVNSLIAKSPTYSARVAAENKPVALAEGATLVNPATGAVVARGAPKPTSYQQKDVLLDGKPAIISFDPASGRSIDAAGNDVSTRVRPVPTASQVSINAGELTDVAIDKAAALYNTTHTLPPGYGAAAIMRNTKIMNRAGELDPTAALAANAATYKADTANLTNLQKTEGTLSAFETTAGKNLDNFITLAAKIPDTGVPWLNRPVRTLSASMLGSADMVAAKAAGDVALREIARVTNDPKLSGALTDSARAEVQGLMSNQSATLPQILAVAKVLKQDMANVHTGINQQIASVKAGMGANPVAPAAPAADTPSTAPHAPAGWKYVAKPGGGWTAVETTAP